MMPTKVFDYSGTFGPAVVPTSVIVKVYGGGAGGGNGESNTDNVSLGTGSGTYNWPADVASADVECWGGGADGVDGTAVYGGGGGGGGGYTKKTYTSPSGSVSYNSGGGGPSGSDSSFDSMTAGGGQGGSTTTAGTGGFASGGDVNTPGSDGVNGSTGGDGGDGGPGGNGGSGGAGGSSGGNGGPGSVFGGGGGGGGTKVGGSSGGAGAPGIISISLNYQKGGHGGGGGAYSQASFDLNVGDSLSVLIGDTVGASTDGNSTTVSLGSTLMVEAVGGKANGNGGLSSDCTGDLAHSGGNAGLGVNAGGGGGGGGCAGTSSDGSPGTNASGTSGGAGGAGGATGGGQGGDGGDLGTNGQDGDIPGGGGGGAGYGFTGGDGPRGKCIIEWDVGPEWFWTGCYCCDSTLPETMDLATNSVCGPVHILGSDPPCGIHRGGGDCGPDTIGPFIIPDGWTLEYDVDVDDGIGHIITVPQAYVSAPIGPWENSVGSCPCYLTLIIWCNRDGSHPPSHPICGPPNVQCPGGYWFANMIWDCPTGYTFPGFSFPPEQWPCAYSCGDISPNGSFVIGFESHGINDIYQGEFFVFGFVPPCPL